MAAAATCCAMLWASGAAHDPTQRVLAPAHDHLILGQARRRSSDATTSEVSVTHTAVMSSARSGTQWFIKTMSQHPNVNYENEIMLDEDAGNQKSVQILQNFYERDTDSPQKKNITVHGFVWMVGQPNEPHRMGFHMDGKGDDDEANVEAIVQGGFKTILLTRAPSLRQLVSLQRLRFTSGEEVHCTKQTTKDGPVMDVEKCLANVAKVKVSIGSDEGQLKRNHTLPYRFAEMEQEWRNIESYLKQQLGIKNVLVVKYEDLLDRPLEMFGQAIEFLGLPPFTVDPDAEIQQNTRVPLRDVLSDYDAVLSEVRGTKWEAELTDDSSGESRSR